MTQTCRLGRPTLLEFALTFCPNSIGAIYCDEKKLSVVSAILKEKKSSKGLKQVSRDRLDELIGKEERGHHGGVVFDVNLPKSQTLESLIGKSKTSKLVVCDGIEDVHNLGAIARSSLLLGADGVVFGESRGAPVTAAAIRASAGTLLLGKFCEVTNVGRSLKDLKESGYWIGGLCASARDEKSKQMNWAKAREFEKLVLVVGSEHKGLRPGVEEACDFFLSIPLKEPYQEVSLNASVAVAVALAHLSPDIS